MEIFGYEIRKKAFGKEKAPNISPIPLPQDDPGSTSVTVGGGYYGQFVDLSGTDSLSDQDLIIRYREASQQPECDAAISDIVDAAIASADISTPVDIHLDDLDYPENVKKQIYEEFHNIVKLYKFNRNAADMFRRWYVDGRIYFQIIIDPANAKKGIIELRPIEATHLKKVREVKKVTDSKTNISYEKVVAEYYIYSRTLMDRSSTATSAGVKIDTGSIIQINSGLYDAGHSRIIGYLHKALKLINQLRFMEDSLVVYRVSRAPERRVFYIDVGNLPKNKAEEYVQSVVSRYRNKLVYDASTGEISDDRRHMSMLEDFYLPRREGGRGTEIDTLGGGENLGQIDDVIFFQRKLYRALNVPLSRLEQETGFAFGRATEISREEVKFQKFIDRIRKKFSLIFTEALKIQLLLKGVITENEWEEIEESINVDFLEDNYFAELKEFEIMRERFDMLSTIDQYVGKYYSNSWIRQNILKQSEEDIERIDKEIDDENKSGENDMPNPDDPRWMA